MIIFPNAKINLGLHIVEKRNDGYHNLETIFYPIPFKDVLEIIVTDIFSFTTSGLAIDTGAEKNICVKAYELLQTTYNLPPVHMHLHKAIPMGAGLGGGSADAACTLMLINSKFNLNLNQQQLIGYALQLGSDCPFFIINKPCFATGRGEIMEPQTIKALKEKQLLIVNPGIHISTSWAFANIKPATAPVNLKEAISQPIQTWKECIVNDFEEAVMKEHPSLFHLKKQLYDAGALYASMTGSGSTFFGIFEKDHPLQITFPKNYLVVSCEL